MTTGNGVTAAITFDSTNLTQTAADLQTALHSLGYDPATTVSVESNSGQYVLRVTWGGADVGQEPLLEYTPVINPATHQPDLAATVTTEMRRRVIVRRPSRTGTSSSPLPDHRP